MKKITKKDLLIYLALFLYIAICLGYTFLNAKMALISIFAITILLLLSKINNFKISLRIDKYTVCCFLMFIPCLYKNAYLEDNNIIIFAYYIFAIINSILFSQIKNKNEYIKFVFYLLIGFACLTSIVTWVSLFCPDLYIKYFINMMDMSVRNTMYNEFVINGNKMGLTLHYSRNAFYIIAGIISVIALKKENKNKLNNFILIFLLLTQIIIGKRGHIVFFIAALCCSYFICSKRNLKNIIKFLEIVVLCLFVLILIFKFVPGASYTYNRFFNIENIDVSSGRFDMYKDAIQQYQDNGGYPIGWAQYAKSTNYYHPGLHNDYFQLFVEVGIAGLFMVVFANIYILIFNIKCIKEGINGLNICCLIFNIFYMLYSITGIPHYDVEVYMVYLLFNAMLVSNVNSNLKVGKDKNENK